MKRKFIKSIILCFIVSACNNGELKNENGVSFETEKLNGKYKMDLTPLIDEKFSQSENNSDGKNLALVSNQ